MSESDPKDAPPPRTILGIAPPPAREKTIQGVAPPASGAKVTRHKTLLGVAIDPNRVPPPDAPPPPPDQPPKPALELVLSGSTSLPAAVAVAPPPERLEPRPSPVSVSASVSASVSVAAPRDDIMSLAPAGVPRRGRVRRVVFVLVLGALAVGGYAARRRIVDLAERYVLTTPPAAPTSPPAASASVVVPASAAPSAALSEPDADAGRPPSDGGAHRPRGPHLPRGRQH
jgi:hypothetical protein